MITVLAHGANDMVGQGIPADVCVAMGIAFYGNTVLSSSTPCLAQGKVAAAGGEFGNQPLIL